MSGFYDSMASVQHLIFANWENSLEWQASVFGPLLERECGASTLRILDCACGIGTQSLGLARRGHRVTGSDLSVSAVERARREAQQRGLAIDFHVADFRDLASIGAAAFDAVLAADNALPHLDGEAELLRAARSIASRLRPGGVFVATIRDYDQMILDRPVAQAPAFLTDNGRRRIVHFIQDWSSERTYTVHIYITRDTELGWECSHHAGVYHAVLREELTRVLESAGFGQIRWVMPEASGFYQPLVIARL